jgi:hypothetical protein
LIVEDDDATTPTDDEGTAVAEILPEVGSPCDGGCDLPPLGGGPQPNPAASRLEVVAWSAAPAWPAPRP